MSYKTIKPVEVALNQISAMEIIKLTASDRKLLKKQQRPTLLLAGGIFVTLTALNFLFHYKDVVLGMEMIERPPVSQLITIQIVGTLISSGIYFSMARAVLKDLRSGSKTSEQTKIIARYFKRIDGELTYFVRLKNGIEATVNKSNFSKFIENQPIRIEYGSKTKLVFDLQPV